MLLRATTTFHAPGKVVITEGSLLDSSEPVVKGREALFEPADGSGVVEPEAPVDSRQVVETATARPGTRSPARRPRKAAAKKAAKSPKD